MDISPLVTDADKLNHYSGLARGALHDVNAAIAHLSRNVYTTFDAFLEAAKSSSPPSNMPWELLGARTFCACPTAVCDEECRSRTSPAPQGLFNPHVAAVPAEKITVPMLTDALDARNVRSASAAMGTPTVVFVALHVDLLRLLAAWLTPVLNANCKTRHRPSLVLVLVLVTILAKVHGGALPCGKSRGIRRLDAPFKCVSKIHHTSIADDAARQVITLLSPS
jgi:hypothetical protein